MNIEKLKELFDRIETADGAEATHRSFLEWAQATRAALPSLIARLEAADRMRDALSLFVGSNNKTHTDSERQAAALAALTTYDQEKAREHG